MQQSEFYTWQLLHGFYVQYACLPYSQAMSVAGQGKSGNLRNSSRNEKAFICKFRKTTNFDLAQIANLEVFFNQRD